LSNYKNTWVTGLFMSRLAAERAVDAIIKAGYKSDDISLLMRDSARSAHFAPVPAPNNDANVATGVGVGGLVGGSVGAVLAGIALAGTALIFPGVGLVVAGPLAAALAGAGAGGAAGGLIGAIVGAGIPEDHARHYEVGLLAGGMVVGVKATSRDQQHKLEAWLGDSGAERVSAA
jgi:hypothetical protein